MAIYTLPELPYDYAALEPHISGRIMELHHDKHHAAYVAGANSALEALAAAREEGNLGAINLWEKNLAFNQQANVPVGTVPLFMVDMWEHAFYLDYLNVKADYVKAIWNIANWSDVAKRLDNAVANAKQLILG